MVNLPTSRKLSIAARVAGQQLKRSRTYSAVKAGARASLSHFGAVVHQLWHEITGFIFLVFAAIGVVASVRGYGAYQSGKITSGRMATAVVFSMVFAWFGVTSFWRSRKHKK